MNPLKPVMAAILAAFSVMSSLPASVFAEDSGVPATAPTQPAAENNAVNILAGLIKNDKQVQADVSARVQRLLLDPDFKGRSYVTADLPNDHAAHAIPEMVTQWVAQHPDKAAELYFVARPLGAAPSWAKSPDGTPIFKDDEQSKALPERLGNYLAGTDQEHPAGSQVGTVAVSGMANSLVKFLDCAAVGAGVILDPGVPGTPEAVRKEDALHDNTAVKPPLVSGKTGGAPLASSGSGFEFDDLYVKGAYVADVYSPKDQGYRRLSVKMYTTSDDKGNVQNMVGVVDITPDDPKTPYGPKMFPMNQSEDATFSLRDGGRSYSLSVTMQNDKHNLVIKRPGSADSGDGVVSVSMEDLAMRRMDQVAERGTLDIGGKQYYALGQGGAKGSILFFAKDEIDGRAALKDPRWTAPAAMAAVSEVAPGGGTRRIDTVPGPDLGKVDGKEYHLEFDGALKMWKVAPGPGYKPPVPKEPAVSAKEAGGSEGSEGSGEPGEPGGHSSGGVVGEAKTLADVVALLEENGFNDDPDANKGFSEDMKKVVHVMVNAAGDPPFCFVLAPGIRPDNQWCPIAVIEAVYDKKGVLVAPQEDLQGIRGFGHYGVVEYSGSKQYLSLDFFAGKEGVRPSGIYGKGGMSEVKDVAIALDILRTYEKGRFTDTQLDKIEALLNAHTAGGTYLISSDKDKKMVFIRNVKEKRTYRVWPAEGSGSGDNAGRGDLQGPGTAFDLSFGPDEKFSQELPFDAARKMVLQKTSADGGTALYLMDDAGEKKWFVMVRAIIDGTPSRSRHVQIFGVGKDGAGKDWNALPGDYSLQGYPSTNVPRGAKMGLVLGDGRGALCLYRSAIPAKDGSNVKDKKANSVGPLVSWGGGDHAKACQAGKF